MELTQQIKNLENKAKDSEYYKDRFESLRSEVKIVMEKLSVILAEPIKGIIKPRSNNMEKNSRMINLAKVLCDRMKKDDSIHLRNEDLEKALREANIPTWNSYRMDLRNILRKMEGINERRDGVKVIFYYDSTKKPINPEIKFEKVSFMG